MAEPTTPTAERTLPRSTPLARRNALILAGGFGLLVAIGTLLLRLPLAAAGRPLTWGEAFFTATSAVTVTGLNVITPAVDLSRGGQTIVLLLMEVGGIGFVVFSVLLFALIGRRLGIASRLLLTQSLGVLQTGNIRRLALSVLLITVAIQLVGASLLWVRWMPALGPGEAAYQALFHAVSAFCNAGFDLFAGTGRVLFGFAHDPFTLTVLMLLIIIGGLGVVDLVTFPWDRRLMVYTKLTLAVKGVLLLSGLIIVAADGMFGGTALEGLSPGEHLWRSLFTVVSTRTAGLTIYPMEDLSQATLLVLMVSMFIGGAPASMGGGITTSTVAVLGVSVLATVRGRPQATAFGRTLPQETIAKAVAIMTIATLLCVGATLLLLILDPQPLLPISFEVVSAFSNTGYSLNITGTLGPLGRVVVATLMFWGRLGPLTLVVLLAQRETPSQVRYPEEQIVIG